MEYCFKITFNISQGHATITAEASKFITFTVKFVHGVVYRKLFLIFDGFILKMKRESKGGVIFETHGVNTCFVSCH